MCKLNVYMIDKYVPGIDVKEIFNHHHHRKFENINDEIELKGYDDNYNYYEASPTKCDCSSVVGLLSDYKDKFHTYVEHLISINKGDIAKLYQIKEMLKDEHYQDKLNNILATRDEMFAKLQSFTKHKQELEARISELTVTNRPNMQDQILIKKLTSELNDVKKQLENNHDYKMCEMAYNDYISRNELMILSRNFTLEHKKDWWQENIDSKINKVEHECHMHVNAEFNHIKTILRDVLKITNEVKLFSFWQEDDSHEYDNLEEVKTISIDNLELEDVIFLDLKQVITITK